MKWQPGDPLYRHLGVYVPRDIYSIIDSSHTHDSSCFICAHLEPIDIYSPLADVVMRWLPGDPIL